MSPCRRKVAYQSKVRSRSRDAAKATLAVSLCAETFGVVVEEQGKLRNPTHRLLWVAAVEVRWPVRSVAKQVRRSQRQCLKAFEELLLQPNQIPDRRRGVGRRPSGREGLVGLLARIHGDLSVSEGREYTRIRPRGAKVRVVWGD